MKTSALRHIIREALIKTLNEDTPEEQPQGDEIGQQPNESAAETAHRLKLKYAGYGKWKDASGNTVAKTVKGKLVRVAPRGGEPTPEEPSTGSKTVLGKGMSKAALAADTDQSDQEWIAQQQKKKGIASQPEPLGAPGSIQPPTTSSGNPIEVTVDGQTGVIDKVLKDDQHTTHITLDSGESVAVPAAKVKVSKKQFNKKNDPAADPEEKPLNIAPETDKQMRKIFKEAGRDPYKPVGSDAINPGWNRGKNDNDVPFDANGEETVKKLLALVGDPTKLVLWLVRLFQRETSNGKKRVLQYLSILKDMGFGNGSAEGNSGEDIMGSEDMFGNNHFSPDQ